MDDFSPTQVKLIGLYEIVCALAVGLPLFTMISPLSILAGSAGLVLLMLGAAYTHFRRGEMQMIIGNAILLTLASVVYLGYSSF